ncbi:MAG: endonuclease/exonuclease/phosphatase family protein [Lentimicrobium sp.]|nr:endonuclease/exonuclease/phosphatase family protein [Lentimicrobium sp.]
MKYFNPSFLFVVFFAFTVNAFSQPLTLISWNLKDLGHTKDATEISFIAETLRHADVVAIQEVVAGDGGAQAVARLVAELNTLGAAWDYAVSLPTVSSSYKTERYAFLWKKHKAKLVGKAWLQQGEYAGLMDREPYFATFEVQGKHFTLVNFHAKTKSKQPETEVKYLKDLPALYPDLNLIFTCDFNLPQSHSVFNPLKKMGYQPVLTNQKTSLKRECLNDDCLASELDNIFYKSDHIKITESGIIHFYKKVETLEQARLISDHVPVYIKFEFH